MSTYGDVRSYYVDQWGEPDREAEFNSKGGFHVGVLKWQVSAATEGVNLYATVGASDYALPGRSQVHRQEFFIGLIPECDDIASPLARLAIQGQMSGATVEAGHTCRVQPFIMDGSGFGGFLIRPSLDGPPAPVLLSDGRHVEFLMVIPAYGDELDFAASHGLDRLMEVMEESNVPFWDPTRRSTFDTD